MTKFGMGGAKAEASGQTHFSKTLVPPLAWATKKYITQRATKSKLRQYLSIFVHLSQNLLINDNVKLDLL